MGSDSRYIKAQQDDPEVAEALVEDEDEDVSWRPQPADWTLMHELLAQIRDITADTAKLIAQLPTTVTNRGEFPQAFPRPESEVAKARIRLKRERQQRYDENLLAFAEQAKARWRAQQAASEKISGDAGEDV